MLIGHASVGFKFVHSHHPLIGDHIEDDLRSDREQLGEEERERERETERERGRQRERERKRETNMKEELVEWEASDETITNTCFKFNGRCGS
jgi:hypothetical protein